MVHPGDNLAKLSAEAEPGTEFVLVPGVYRVANIVPKDRQVFEGQGRAVISGAVVLMGFTRDSSNTGMTVWRAQGPAPLPLSYGACDAKRWKDTADGCFYRESLFADGRLVPRVFAAAEVKGDTWFQNRDSGEIVIGFDPTGYTIEISHAETAFIGSASGVVIRGLTLELFASLAQHGAIQADKTSDWVIENDLVRLNSGSGVRTGNGMRMTGNQVLANGQIGVEGSGDGIVLEDNEIAFNNTHGFSPAWEAGGTKFVVTNNLTAARNCVHDNAGTGLWTDIDNRDVTFVNNISAHNSGVGIFHEIGGRSLIVGNLVVANGVGDSPWDSQILVSGSIDTVVRGNRVVVARDHGNGIYVVEEGRANQSKIVQDGPTYAASGNVVTGNEIWFLGDEGSYGYFHHGTSESTLLRDRNHFANNTVYVGDDRPRFSDVGKLADIKTEIMRDQELGSKLIMLNSEELTRIGLKLSPRCKID